MNIKPLADRVLVLPAQAEEKVGGIIIPRRHRALWQICWYRAGGGWREVSHHAPERCARRGRLTLPTHY